MRPARSIFSVCFIFLIFDHMRSCLPKQLLYKFRTYLGPTCRPPNEIRLVYLGAGTGKMGFVRPAKPFFIFLFSFPAQAIFLYCFFSFLIRGGRVARWC